MSEKRVYEYAKELGLNNEDLIIRLEDYGFRIENHLSTISEDKIKPYRPVLYNHSGGALNLEDFASKVGLPQEEITTWIRVLNNEPDRDYYVLEEPLINLLTSPQRILMVEELALRLGLSPKKTLKILRKLGCQVKHTRSKINPLATNVLEKIKISGIKKYIKTRKKLGLKVGETKPVKISLAFKVGRYFAVLMMIFVFLAIAYIAYGFYGLTKISQPGKLNPKNNLSLKHKKIKPGQPINVLVLGVEATSWDYDARSDTIMVVRVNPKKDQITIFSLPRDSQVKIENYGLQKLTHAHFYGGSQLMKETIYKNFGIPIDRCVEINFKGFYEIVDFIGGVDMEIEKPIRSPKFWDFDPFTIPAGKQHLNAKEALAYVHFRFDKKGDIGRIERQQKFIKVISSQIKSTNNIIDLPRLINRLAKYIRSDMTISEMLTWARFLWNINIDEVETEMMPGQPEMIYDKWAKKKLSYWIVDHELGDPLIEDIFNLDLDKEETATVPIKIEEEGKEESSDSTSEKKYYYKKVYIVEKGDNISSIAQMHGVSINEILENNPQIENPRNIQVGQEIIIVKKSNHNLRRD